MDILKFKRDQYDVGQQQHDNPDLGPIRFETMAPAAMAMR